MNIHADTCCAGSNWTLMHYTGEIFEVSPFLNTYAPVQEIPVSRCCTIWTNDEIKEYLLVGDESYGLEQHWKIRWLIRIRSVPNVFQSLMTPSCKLAWYWRRRTLHTFWYHGKACAFWASCADRMWNNTFACHTNYGRFMISHNSWYECWQAKTRWCRDANDSFFDMKHEQTSH